MALIQSGASADLLTVGATSKAARVEQYDSAGFEVQKPSTGSYMLPINLVHDNAMAAGETVWAMRYVTGALVAKIKRIRLTMGFNGTAAAATPAYRLVRFSAATPTGGTAITVIKKRNSYAGSVVTDARFDSSGVAGLTVAGVTFETAFEVFSCPASVTGTVATRNIEFALPGERFGHFDLAAGEGLAIQMETASIAGNTLAGGVEWDEVV